MELGFITACLPAWTLAELVTWAGGTGYGALEVCAWPADGPRAGEGPTHLDVRRLDDRTVDEVGTLLDEHGVTVCSLAYYDNPLHPDPASRDAVRDHLHACIDAADRLGVPTVGTFVGRHPGRTVADDLADAEEVLAPFVDHAGERGVRLVVENCPMPGWHPDGMPGNLAYSPELWEWLTSLGLWLNYDPSHLPTLGIDPVAVIAPVAERIALVQAKDVEVDVAQRDRFGWPGRTVSRDDAWDVGWWRYRVPGHGQLDWSAIVGELRRSGYDGVVSVELEDRELGEEDGEVTRGLGIAAATLRPLLAG